MYSPVAISLRFGLAPAETAKGLQRMVLAAAPLPETTRQGRPATAVEVTPETAPEALPAPEVLPETAPQVLPEAAPEVTPRPALEVVPRIGERSPAAPEKQPGPVTPERLAEFYADDIAAGRVPSKRQIKREWPVGFDAASELHEQLAATVAAP